MSPIFPPAASSYDKFKAAGVGNVCFMYDHNAAVLLFPQSQMIGEDTVGFDGSKKWVRAQKFSIA